MCKGHSQTPEGCHCNQGCLSLFARRPETEILSKRQVIKLPLAQRLNGGSSTTSIVPAPMHDAYRVGFLALYLFVSNANNDIDRAFLLPIQGSSQFYDTSVLVYTECSSTDIV